jgi:hypothetical protein
MTAISPTISPPPQRIRSFMPWSASSDSPMMAAHPTRVNTLDTHNQTTPGTRLSDRTNRLVCPLRCISFHRRGEPWGTGGCCSHLATLRGRCCHGMRA